MCVNIGATPKRGGFLKGTPKESAAVLRYHWFEKHACRICEIDEPLAAQIGWPWKVPVAATWRNGQVGRTPCVASPLSEHKPPKNPWGV